MFAAVIGDVKNSKKALHMPMSTHTSTVISTYPGFIIHILSSTVTHNVHTLIKITLNLMKLVCSNYLKHFFSLTCAPSQAAGGSIYATAYVYKQTKF